MRLPVLLWVVAGLMAGAISFFGLDPLTQGVFVAGAVVGVVIGLALLLRPGAAAVHMASDIGGLAWLLAFGTVVIVSIGNPLEEWLSVVTLLALGVAGAVTARSRRGEVARP